MFTVDTVAPRAALTAAAAPVPGASRSAAFAFSAQDTSPVSLFCRLSVAGPQPAGAAALNAGRWTICTSPQVQQAKHQTSVVLEGRDARLAVERLLP